MKETQAELKAFVLSDSAHQSQQSGHLPTTAGVFGLLNSIVEKLPIDPS